MFLNDIRWTDASFHTSNSKRVLLVIFIQSLHLGTHDGDLVVNNKSTALLQLSVMKHLR